MYSTMGISVMEANAMYTTNNNSSGPNGGSSVTSRSANMVTSFSASDTVSSIHDPIPEEPDSPTITELDTNYDKKKLGDKLDLTRRVILDEDRFEDTFLKCVICRDNFDTVDKIPKILACHHTFCQSCLLEMFRVECEFRANLTSAYRSHLPSAVKIQCPTCRESVIISEADIRKLSRDITVLMLLEFVREAEFCVISFCPKHGSNPLNFFCDTCVKPICSECTVSDHQMQDGHNVINITEAMNKYSPEIDDTLTKIDNEAGTVLEARAAVETAIDNLNKAETEVVNDIHATFEKFHTAANQREQDLINICEREIGRKRSALAEKLEFIKRHQGQMQSSRDQLVQAKELDDVEHIFKQHKALKETLAQPVELPSYNQEEFSALFNFEPKDQSQVLDTLDQFGDVAFQNN